MPFVPACPSAVWNVPAVLFNRTHAETLKLLLVSTTGPAVAAAGSAGLRRIALPRYEGIRRTGWCVASCLCGSPARHQSIIDLPRPRKGAAERARRPAPPLSSPCRYGKPFTAATERAEDSTVDGDTRPARSGLSASRSRWLWSGCPWSAGEASPSHSGLPGKTGRAARAEQPQVCQRRRQDGYRPRHHPGAVSVLRLPSRANSMIQSTTASAVSPQLPPPSWTVTAKPGTSRPPSGTYDSALSTPSPSSAAGHRRVEPPHLRHLQVLLHRRPSSQAASSC